MKQISLTQGKYALVDDEDFERLNQHKWQVCKKGYCFYAQRSIQKSNGGWTTSPMHRQVMSAPPDMQVDHHNHNGLDNRKANLRLCTRSQQQHNQLSHKNTSSKYKGVCWYKLYKKWLASIRYMYKSYHLGYFYNEVEAAKAYDAKAKEIFGEFACLNFPDKGLAAV